MAYHGVNVTTDAGGNSTCYWLVSRCEYKNYDNASFGIRFVGNDGYAIYTGRLWYVYSDNRTVDSSAEYGVRACVTVVK